MKTVYPVATFLLLAFLVLVTALFAADSTFKPGLLEKVEERGKVSAQEDKTQFYYNPPQEGLMQAKQQARIQDMTYQREHEFDNSYMGWGDWGSYDYR